MVTAPRRRRAHRRLAIAVPLALLAGCGSTVSGVTGTAQTPGQGSLSVPTGAASAGGAAASELGGGSGGAGGVSAPAGTSASAAGPTSAGGSVASSTTGNATSPSGGKAIAAAAPIKVGILLTTIGQAQALGLKVGNTYSEQDFDDAVIKAMNKRGGLLGHRIVPVYAETNTASTNWDSDYQAACATFTQDNHVDVVLGSSFAYERSLESCLARAGIPHLTNSSNVPDNEELKKYPLLRALIVPTIDKRSIEQVDGAMNTGFLTPKNRIGVIVDSCPDTPHAWTDVVRPYMQSRHLNVVSTADEGCASGYNDSFTAAGANVSNAVLTFRSQGVDRITFVTVSETGPLLAMQEEASSQHYYPGWIVNSLVGTATLAGQAPADQMRNTRVYGWAPFVDVAPGQFPPANASQRRCVADASSQGVKPSSAADYAYLFSICEALFAYDAALTKAGSVITGSSVIDGLDRLGRSLQSVALLDGATDFSTSRLNDVPRVYRELVFQSSCTCFIYHGPRYQMP